MRQTGTAGHIGLYFAFLAIPLAGVFLVLHLGRDVKPKTSIAGHWRADVETSIAAARGCHPGWGKDHATLEITQDGTHIELDFTEVRLRLEGVFAGGGIDASGRYEDTTVRFIGTLGGTTKQLTVSGKLHFGCPYPLAVAVEARKVP